MSVGSCVGIEMDVIISLFYIGIDFSHTYVSMPYLLLIMMRMRSDGDMEML